MLQFLSIFGPASITYLLIHQLLGKDTVSWFNALVEFICYATLDAAVTMVILSRIRRLEYFLMPNGIRNFQYIGMASFAIAVTVAVVAGFAISVIRKYISVTIEAELRGGRETHESEGDS